MVENSKRVIHFFNAANGHYNNFYIDQVKKNSQGRHQFIDASTIQPIAKPLKNHVKPASFFTMLKNLKTNKHDAIILHSCFLPFKFIIAWLIVRPKKAAWVLWGGDLYVKSAKSLKHKVYHYFAGKLKKQISYYITQISGDFNLAKKRYNHQAKHLYAFYPVHFHDVPKGLAKQYIQIGNSRDASNKQLEILNALLLSKSNHKLFVPLAYGHDLEHSNIIKQFLKKNFDKNKVHILDELVPFEEYQNILNLVDIAFFNHDRQQAVGNILVLIAKGATVYINPHITTWEFLKAHQLVVKDISQYKTDHILERLGEKQQQDNMRLVRKAFSLDRCIESWVNVFNEMKDHD